MKEHPHDILINKLEECRDELRELRENYPFDSDEYIAAADSIDTAIDDTRAIEL